MDKIYINGIFRLEDFKNSIPFTALGARTCYSSGGLDYLLNDPRVITKEDRAKFLSKLGNFKHFSVFSHSFAYKDLKDLNEEELNKYIDKELSNLSKEKKAEILALKIASTHFKTHYNPKYPTVIGVSLRHYLEDLLQYSEKLYQECFIKMADYDIPIEPLGKKKHTTLIGLVKEYDGYGVFFIDNVSRTMTHQLVRHTALNYSQRSQRYVREDKNQLIIPPSINGSSCEININPLKLIEFIEDIVEKTLNTEKLKGETKAIIKERFINLKEKVKYIFSLEELYKLTDNFLEFIYQFSVYNCKIKREDARFILPHGRKTTIVVSGTLSWLYDFINKRVDPHAQWEIRTVASEMKELLDENLK